VLGVRCLRAAAAGSAGPHGEIQCAAVYRGFDAAEWVDLSGDTQRTLAWNDFYASNPKAVDAVLEGRRTVYMVKGAAPNDVTDGHPHLVAAEAAFSEMEARFASELERGLRG